MPGAQTTQRAGITQGERSMFKDMNWDRRRFLSTAVFAVVTAEQR
jgi:hypothetical protein